jgi:hypothetical protein
MRQERATVLVRALVPELAREQRLASVQVQVRASVPVPAQVQVPRPALVPVQVLVPEQVQVPLLVALPQVQLRHLTHQQLRSRFQPAPSPLLARESPSAFQQSAREPRCQLCRSTLRTTARQHARHRRPS